MRNARVYYLSLILLVFCTLSLGSCARKSGCPTKEMTRSANVRKNGKPKKSGTMQLFDGKSRKKMGKGRRR